MRVFFFFFEEFILFLYQLENPPFFEKGNTLEGKQMVRESMEFRVLILPVKTGLIAETNQEHNRNLYIPSACLSLVLVIASQNVNKGNLRGSWAWIFSSGGEGKRDCLEPGHSAQHTLKALSYVLHLTHFNGGEIIWNQTIWAPKYWTCICWVFCASFLTFLNLSLISQTGLIISSSPSGCKDPMKYTTLSHRKLLAFDCFWPLPTTILRTNSHKQCCISCKVHVNFS